MTDAYGNGQHVSIDVVSNQFEGQSSMKRQRMVYKVCCCAAQPGNLGICWSRLNRPSVRSAVIPAAISTNVQAIWYELQSAVHAVDSMSTKTPAEAAA